MITNKQFPSNICKLLKIMHNLVFGFFFQYLEKQVVSRKWLLKEIKKFNGINKKNPLYYATENLKNQFFNVYRINIAEKSLPIMLPLQIEYILLLYDFVRDQLNYNRGRFKFKIFQFFSFFTISFQFFVEIFFFLQQLFNTSDNLIAVFIHRFKEYLQ